jgi:hypothetical protein
MDEPHPERRSEMLDPGALGTLIIRENAQRADAERVAAGVAATVADGQPGGIRVAVARGLRRFATSLAGPETSDRPWPVAAASLGLTWTDR